MCAHLFKLGKCRYYETEKSCIYTFNSGQSTHILTLKTPLRRSGSKVLKKNLSANQLHNLMEDICAAVKESKHTVKLDTQMIRK